MKTSDLTGPALDWAVAKCEGAPLVYRGRKWPTDGAATIEYAPWAVHPVVDGSGPYVPALCHSSYNPSTKWLHGGPIIEREKIDVMWCGDRWCAYAMTPDKETQLVDEGPTPLIAAMRCYVASRFGDTIDVPEELL